MFRLDASWAERIHQHQINISGKPNQAHDQRMINHACANIRSKHSWRELVRRKPLRTIRIAMARTQHNMGNTKFSRSQQHGGAP
jgi:hypothetical protein